MDLASVKSQLFGIVYSVAPGIKSFSINFVASGISYAFVKSAAHNHAEADKNNETQVRYLIFVCIHTPFYLAFKEYHNKEV